MSIRKALCWAPVLAITAMLVFLPKAINGAGVRNWTAVQVVRQAMARADTPLEQYQSMYPILAMFVYVPNKSPSTTESLDALYTTLELGAAKAWITLLARTPLFVSNAPVNVGWSWLGYDLYNNEVGNYVVRIYGESPRTLSSPASLSAADEPSPTLLAGQRLYQDALLDERQIDNWIDDSQMPSGAGCPERKSIVGNQTILDLLTGIFPESSIRVYAVPVTRNNQFCYFGFVWSGLDDLDEMHTTQVVAEDDDGFWGLIEFSNPPLLASFPFWNFAAIPTTLGWHGYNSQTSVESTESGLIVSAIGNDAAIVSPEIRLDTHLARYITVTAQAYSGNTIQLFWKTLDAPYEFAEQQSSSQHLYEDGAWHTYEFDMTDNPQWQGIVTHLRLDPTNTSGDIMISEVIVR